MSGLQVRDVQDMARKFVDDREWSKYHKPKDLAMSISIEAAELLEIFQWTDRCPSGKDGQRVGEEIADVILYCASLANALGLDLARVIEEKVEKNNMKYPVDVVAGAESWEEVKERLGKHDKP